MSNRLDLVKECLTKHPAIASWYEHEFGVTLASFTAANINVYGTGGMGDLASSIIDDMMYEEEFRKGGSK